MKSKVKKLVAIIPLIILMIILIRLHVSAQESAQEFTCPPDIIAGECYRSSINLGTPEVSGYTNYRYENNAPAEFPPVPSTTAVTWSLIQSVPDQENPDSMVDKTVATCTQYIKIVNRFDVGPSGHTFSSIQSAINAACDGDEVIVYPGIYMENINFKGKAITVRSTNSDAPMVVSSTIIDGGQAGSVVIFSSGEGNDSKLVGLTVRNGIASYPGGGGIWCRNSSPTISNCNISNNRVNGSGNGGGIHCRNSSPTISNCNISKNKVNRKVNRCGGAGGGIYCTDSSAPIIDNCLISENEANEGIECYSMGTAGGGIACSGSSSAKIINCIITKNSSSRTGGGIHGNSLTIERCKIIENHALGMAGGGIDCSGNLIITDSIISGNSAGTLGGGIYSRYGPSIITNCIITANSANNAGGISYYKTCGTITNCSITHNSSTDNCGGISIRSSSVMTIDNCAISNNITKDFGGGIMCSNWSSLTIVNSIVCKNSAGTAGGIYFEVHSTGAITNCTFTENAVKFGGGIYANDYSSFTITNCILWGDAPNEISRAWGCSAIVTYSDIQGGYEGEGNISSDPSFVNPYGNIGILTKPIREGKNISFGALIPDYHLKQDSPCIDAGTNISAPDKDKDDILRNGVCDMGAYEFCGASTFKIKLNQDPLIENYKWKFYCLDNPSETLAVFDCDNPILKISGEDDLKNFIKGDYEVKLTIDYKNQTSSPETRKPFTVYPAVYLFKQGDGQWAGHYFGHHNGGPDHSLVDPYVVDTNFWKAPDKIKSTCSIGDLGCSVTCLAMVLNYLPRQHDNASSFDWDFPGLREQQPFNPWINPQNLNDKLRQWRRKLHFKSINDYCVIINNDYIDDTLEWWKDYDYGYLYEIDSWGYTKYRLPASFMTSGTESCNRKYKAGTDLQWDRIAYVSMKDLATDEKIDIKPAGKGTIDDPVKFEEVQELIDNTLEQGYPIITAVNEGKIGHFVVITQKEVFPDNTYKYLINDPGYDKDELEIDKFVGYRIYTVPETQTRYKIYESEESEALKRDIRIILTNSRMDCPYHFVIIDNIGRKTGFDLDSNNPLINEIPNTNFDYRQKYLSLLPAAYGNYTLETRFLCDSDYDLDYEIVREDGVICYSTNLSRDIEEGELHRYNLDNHEDPNQITIEIIDDIPSLTSLSVWPQSINLDAVGAQRYIKVTGTLSDGSIQDLTSTGTGTTYLLNNESVATVSSEGLITAVGVGDATLTARNGEFLETRAISINRPPLIEVAPKNITLNWSGDRKQLMVTGIYSDDITKNLTSSYTGTSYNSSDYSIVTVSADGLISAVGKGTAIITATNGSLTDTCEVTVNIEPWTLCNIEISPEEIVLTDKITQQLTVTGFYGTSQDGSIQDITASGSGTTYIIADASVAEISSDGLITAKVLNATATITANHEGFSDTCQLTISLPPIFSNFSADNLSGLVPFTVNFSDNSGFDITNWYWDFGDGQTSTEQNPTHTYYVLGMYSIYLAVSNTDGSDSVIKTDYITANDVPPVADFSADNQLGPNPLMVSFTDTSTGFIIDWYWDFGDGETSIEQNLTHTYTKGGVYTVSLTATNSGGSDTETKIDYITVTEVLPIADFSADKTTGQNPLTVNFTDTSTGPISEWLWDFGDGETSIEQNPTYSYTKGGIYTIFLTVTNSDGSDTKTKIDYITVTEVLPMADFSADTTIGQNPLTVNFTDTSTGPISGWLWDFGDGETSTEQNPTHIYMKGGIYTVSLTVINSDGSDTKTKINHITVIEVDFSVTNTIGPIPLSVHFTDISTGPISEWLWDFGDGEISTEQNPTHTYYEDGKYTITLSVIVDDNSYTNIKTDYIFITEDVYQLNSEELLSQDNKADYLIITADAFNNNNDLNKFAIHRAHNSNLKVAIVNLNDIYTIFPALSSDPETLDQAIKNFIISAYDNWTSPKISYLLLVGDADEGQEDRAWFLPTHYVSSRFSDHAATDQWYASLDGDDFADLFIGRFPAQSKMELQAMVDKTIAFPYADSGDNEWGSRILLTSGFNEADRSSIDGQFKYIRGVSLLNRKEVFEYYEDEGANIPDTIINHLEEKGVLIHTHAGHGNTTQWANEISTFDSYHASALKNTLQPIIFTVSCEVAEFDNNQSIYGSTKCLGESFLKNNDGGAVAFFGASRVTGGFDHAAAFNLILSQHNYIVGSVVMGTNLASSCSPNEIKIFNLLGDPALDLSPFISSRCTKPDLTIWCEAENTNVYYQEPIKIKIIVANRKGLTPAEGVNVEFYNGPSEEGQSLGLIDMYTIYPEESFTYTWEWEEYQEHGTYDINIMVDPENKITELSEYNNKCICTIIVEETNDLDGDGFYIIDGDCDDFDPNSYPGAPEICDGKDNDCDNTIPENEMDEDNDGYMLCNGDCDDFDPNSYPGATEICDGKDNDCDNTIPENEMDEDNDGYMLCNGECNDNNPDINPGVTEVYNGIDDDCDGMVDEKNTFFKDADGDGYGNAKEKILVYEPPSGYVLDNTDCDDTNPQINPGMAEVPNGIDDNCDGLVDKDPIYVFPGESIQGAINEAGYSDMIIVYEGIYRENINFRSKAITLKSTNPDDPEVVANTIIDGGKAGSVVGFTLGENNTSVLSGFTIRNGSGSMWYAGGICVNYSSPTISNCIITENSGPGIEISHSSSPSITNCSITKNSNGGIWCYDSSSPTISNCIIKENSSVLGGGIYLEDTTLCIIKNCIISGNSAGYGGGIYCRDASPTITNCIISGNHGGAFRCLGESSPFIINCTITGNGGIKIQGGTSPTITNCIFWDSFSLDTTATPTVTYSNIKGGYEGEGNISLNPLFIDPDAGDYHLQCDSLCIDAGTNEGAPDTDKDGVLRPWDGDFDGIAGYDMGAYEYDGGPCPSIPEIHVYPGDSVQEAINGPNTFNGTVIIVHEGVYYENINFLGMAITVRSKDPNDPNVTASTIIDGGGLDSVITFQNGEGSESVLAGISVRNGGTGINCSSASSPTITNCIISDNSTGVSCSSSSPSIINCTITKNLAQRNGGGIYCRFSSPRVANCIISGNIANNHGGGIYCDSSSPTITNCTINGNTAGYYGGGIYCVRSSSPTITNCTISDNIAVDGGGIYCDSSSPAITNCILWHNTQHEIYLDKSNPTVTYSNIQGGYEGEGNINADPLFVGSENGNYYLISGSPCIDKGTSTNVPSEDKEGIARPQGAGIDMGAYEYVEPPSCTPRASFIVDQTIGNDSLSVVFDASSSGGSEYSGIEFWWDFGDGSTGSGLTVSHTYTNYGSYDVSLTITTACGSHKLILNDLIIIKSSQPTKEVGEGYAYTSIQEAIDEADYGEMILVHDGDYFENISFKGKEITVYSKNGAAATIIDGSANGSVVRFDHGEGVASKLEGFTIQNGKGFTISNSTVSYGGGIYCLGSTPAITNCTISGNFAQGGGGICCIVSSPAITNCTISSNNGDGIYCEYSSPAITNCTISSNNGGGIYCDSSSPTITNCTISKNISSNNGGGIGCRDYSSPRIANCIISGNTADDGGGIYCRFSSPVIINCTITSNTAEKRGGGIYFYSSSPVITNCILWHNPSYEIYIKDSNPTITYSDIQGGYEGEGNINADPLFVRSENGNYYLRSDSPCIDTGTSTNASSEDKVGIARPQGVGIDMGAYEYVKSSSCTPRAFFTADKTTGTDSLAVLFDALSSGGSEYSGAEFLWDFGDGTSGSGPTVFHDYTYGSYDVSLSVATSCGSHKLTLNDLIKVKSSQPTKEVGGGYVYVSIQEAIDDADYGEVILVNDGIYFENISFKGKEITVCSKNGAAATIIDGSASGSVVWFDHGEGPDAVLDGFTIQNGSASEGGGIYCDWTSPTITNCTISANMAEYDGGGIYCYESSSTITNCTISGNSANNGGGIYSYRSSPALTNCTISGNSANNGGGIYSYFGTPIITNCTISDNIAKYAGGGLYRAYGALVITNCILWNNSPKEIYGICTITYSNIHGGYEGEGNIDANPLFVDPNVGDYRLQPSSPCINTGTNIGAPNTDKDDNPRPVGTGYDIGAYEFLDCSLDSLITVYQDGDGDNYGNPNAMSFLCTMLNGYVDNNLDCNDNDKNINPDAIEACNKVDDDCDLQIDEEGAEGCTTYYKNVDEDPYGDSNDSRCLCTSEYAYTAIQGGDCDDSNSEIYPNASEICDGIDNDCDDKIPENETDEDNDGYMLCNGECNNNNPDINPGVEEVHNGLDDNCNGLIDEKPIYVSPGDSIQTAINMAIDKDVIIVRPGIYIENINFLGKAITIRSTNPNDPNVVANTIIFANNTFNFVGMKIDIVVTFNNGEDLNSVLSGFTLQNGGDTRGVYCNSSSPSITNCTITDNLGSGLYCNSSSASITNCTITNNLGSGLYCKSSSPSITNCTITDNLGSGVHCNSSSPSIINCAITSNSANDGGGIYCCASSSPSITHCTITNNSAADDGGGIYCCSSSSPSITNCAITNNSADDDGDGIYCYYSSPYVVNSIIWNNGSEIYIASQCSNPKLSYCDIQGGYPGLGNLDADPLFVDPANSDYHLGNASPCIDSGHPRMNDGNGSRSDIGVYGGEGGWESNTVNITVASDTSEDFTFIQDAIDYAVPGDTITVFPGEYTENLVIVGKELSLISKKAIIDGSESGSVIALVNSGSSSLLEGFTIQNGATMRASGGIYILRDSPTITDCIITANSADDDGGGIYCYSSSPSITNCIITSNSADDYGGGIYCYSSSPSITNCIITSNSANNYGGGIYCRNFSANIYIPSPIITNCTITSNSADAGGGIYCDYSSPSITNCTITSNSADAGGGIYCDYSSPSITNCTITSNSADAGGGIYCYNLVFNTYNSSPIITNCIIWNDSPYEIFTDGGTITFTYSNIQGGYQGEGNIDPDPLFVDPNVGDYRLQPSSPCINTGTNIGAPNTDKDDNPRPVGTGYDIGAYEFLDCSLDSLITVYQDGDGDNYGDPNIVAIVCTMLNGYVENGDDCNDSDPNINPIAAEACNGIDDDCDGAVPANEDDADGDNFRICEGDFNDNDPTIYPGATESCDGVDNDCDGYTDEEDALGCSTYYKDADNDTYGLDEDTRCLCAAEGDYKATRGGDCDDDKPDVYPQAAETCDGIDNDCDGYTDEEDALGCTTYYKDADNDTYGLDEDTRCLCAAEGNYKATRGGDCDDDKPNVYPQVAETCDGLDNDCDGYTDEEDALGCTTYYKDTDNDTYGLDEDTRCLCTAEGDYKATQGGDCDDDKPNVYPQAAETCDGLDNDCDGYTDEEDAAGCTTYYKDADNDTYGLDEDTRCLCAAEGDYKATQGGDCYDDKPDVYPQAAEFCDGVDNDCDGYTDEEDALGCTTYYKDTDNDTYGLDEDTRCLCTAEGDYKATRGGDCDDDKLDVYPQAAEICDGVDNDCDGYTDEEDALGCTTYYKDADNDTYGLDEDTRCLCAAEGDYKATRGGDCYDSDPNVNPKEIEAITIDNKSLEDFELGRNVLKILNPSCYPYTSFDLLSDFKELGYTLNFHYRDPNSGSYKSTYWFFGRVIGEKVEFSEGPSNGGTDTKKLYIIDRVQ